MVRHLPLAVPDELNGTDWVSIDPNGEDEAVEGSVEHLDLSTPVSSDRSIALPLRRWAAGHLLRIEPNAFDAMRSRAGELGARGSVGILALDLLAMRDPEAAGNRVATDPDQKVRRWTPRR